MIFQAIMIACVGLGWVGLALIAYDLLDGSRRRGEINPGPIHYAAGVAVSLRITERVGQ